MCGIIGSIGEDSNHETFKKALKIQSHRGPDFTGTFFENGFAEENG